MIKGRANTREVTALRNGIFKDMLYKNSRCLGVFIAIAIEGRKQKAGILNVFYSSSSFVSMSWCMWIEVVDQLISCF
jgi:hypothetical protein